MVLKTSAYVSLGMCLSLVFVVTVPGRTSGGQAGLYMISFKKTNFDRKEEFLPTIMLSDSIDFVYLNYKKRMLKDENSVQERRTNHFSNA